MAIESIRPAVRHGVRTPQKTALLNAEQTKALTASIKNAVQLDAGEQAALSKLSASQRKQYLAVASRLGPAEREQLKTLLASGKLAGARDLTLGGDLLANLAKLATEPLGPGVERRDVLDQAIRAIADPASITQGAAQTCGAATAQILLAKENPAEYVRILAGLASAAGKVQLISGNTISRPASWDRAEIPGAANQLLQTAFMSYAAGGYDAATDTRADGQKGLYASEQAFLQEGLLGKATDTLHGNGDDVMERIAADANAGKAVSVLIEDEGRGHYVQVKAVKDGKLTYVDPRDGQERTVDAAGFREKIKAANVESKDRKTLRKARPTDQKGILGGCGIFKAIARAFKAVVKAVVSVVKAVVKAVVTVVKAVVKAVVSVVKAVVNVVLKVAKAVWEGIKAVANFIYKNLGVILTVLQVVCMFVPGLQVVSLAIAAYQAVKSGVAMVKGIIDGDWKAALGGAIGLVSSVAGGVGALGAKVVGQGLAAAANIAGKVANVAGNVMNAADAIANKNWGGLISSVANGVAAGAGIVSDKAAAVAEKWAGYANKLNGVYQAAVNGDVGAAVGSAASFAGELGKGELGMNRDTAAALGKISKVATAVGGVEKAAKTGDALAIAGAGLGLAQTGLQIEDRKAFTDDQKKTFSTLDKIVNIGKQGLNYAGQALIAIRNHGPAAVLGVLGGAAALGGARYVTMNEAERERAKAALAKAGADWGKGDFDSAAKSGATVLGVDKDGTFAGILGKVGTFAGNALEIAGAWSRAQNLSAVAVRTGVLNVADAEKNNASMKSGLEGLGKLFGLVKDEKPVLIDIPTTPGTARLADAAKIA
jgi:hypothetical protein